MVKQSSKIKEYDYKDCPLDLDNGEYFGYVLI